MTVAEERSGGDSENACVFAALQDFSDEAIVFSGLDGTIRSWSRGAEHAYGYPAAEALGRDLGLIAAPERKEEMDCHLTRLRRGEEVPSHETVRRTKGGVEIDVSTRMTTVRGPDGEVIGVLIVDRDLTEQRWTATALDATLARLQGAIADARSADDRSRRFLSDAAHQLRSPIASIRVCIEALLQGMEADERDRLFGEIVRQTARAGRLVASLLRIARLDEGEDPVRQPCDLVQLCQHEADRVWHLVPNIDVVLRAEVGEELPKLDPGAVQEIVANLLENAVRYAVSEVTVEIKTVDGAVELRVGDDGPGLPPGMEEEVFDRFVAVGVKGGSGLGLPIARAIARAHGGDLTYQQRQFVARLTID